MRSTTERLLLGLVCAVGFGLGLGLTSVGALFAVTFAQGFGPAQGQPFVRLSGSTMSGDLNMGGNDVTNVGAFSGGSAVLSSTITAAGGTMSGALDMGNQLITNIGSAGTDFTSGGALTLAGSLLLPDGAESAPALAFSDNTGTGILSRNNNEFDFAFNGASKMVFSAGAIKVGNGSNTQIVWSTAGDPDTQAGTTGIAASAAGVLDVTNGSTGAGALRLRSLGTLPAVTEPSAPANGAILWAQLNASSKVEYVIKYPGGATSVLATEP